MDDRPTPTQQDHGLRPRAPRTLLGLQIAVVVILVGWALHATASVSALIAAALFVAFVLAPLDRAVAERTGHGWIGHAVALVIMIVALLAFAAGLFFAAQRVATEFPALSQMPTEAIPGVGTAGEEAQAAQAQDGASEEGSGGLLSGLAGGGGALVTRLADLASSVAVAGLQFATAALGGIVLVIFLAFMMLVDAPNWHKRIGRVAGERRRDEALDAVAVVGRMVARYVVVRAAMGLLTAVLYMAWLWPFGVDLILVWGVLTFLLSFIPNLGSILSGILPTIYAFLTKDFGTALAVGVGLTAIEQVIGNYIDPRVQGRQVSLSPTMILVALLVFAWIWGVPGTLLSTPVMIAAVVVFARIDPLRPVALLLSDCDDYDALGEMVRD